MGHQITQIGDTDVFYSRYQAIHIYEEGLYMLNR